MNLIECPWCGKWLEVIKNKDEYYYHCDCGYYMLLNNMSKENADGHNP